MLVSKPGVKGGRLCLRGTGIPVHNVAGYYRMGHTAEEMAAENPHLAPGLFHAAVAFYLANKAEIDAEIDAEEAWAEEMAAAFPHGIGREETFSPEFEALMERMPKPWVPSDAVR